MFFFFLKQWYINVLPGVNSGCGLNTFQNAQPVELLPSDRSFSLGPTAICDNVFIFDTCNRIACNFCYERSYVTVNSGMCPSRMALLESMALQFSSTF